MGSAVKRVKQSFAKLLAVVGTILIVLAICYWNKSFTLDMSGLFGASVRNAKITLTHWQLLLGGIGTIFMAYVFDAKAAAEVVGIPIKVAADVVEVGAKAAGDTLAAFFGSLQPLFKPLALGVGGIYLFGKLISNDNSKPGGHVTIDLGDSRPRQEFDPERRDGGKNTASQPFRAGGLQEDASTGSGELL